MFLMIFYKTTIKIYNFKCCFTKQYVKFNVLMDILKILCYNPQVNFNLGDTQ